MWVHFCMKHLLSLKSVKSKCVLAWIANWYYKCSRKILKTKTSADMTYGDQLIFFIDRILNFFYDFPVSIFHYLFVIVSQICLDNFLLLDYFSEQSLLVFPFVLFVRKVWHRIRCAAIYFNLFFIAIFIFTHGIYGWRMRG